jgi:hypothetical protein
MTSTLALNAKFKGMVVAEAATCLELCRASLAFAVQSIHSAATEVSHFGSQQFKTLYKTSNMLGANFGSSRITRCIHEA